MWKALFPNTIYELDIGIVSSIFTLTFIALWKRAFCVYLTLLGAQVSNLNM